MSKTFVADLRAGQPVRSSFLAQKIQIRQKRTGEEYLFLVLADRTGQVPAVMWQSLPPEIRALADGDIVKVQGVFGTYQGQPQLTISRLRKASAEEIDERDYLPCSAKDPVESLRGLAATAGTITTPPLRQLVQIILDDPALRPQMLEAPAATSNHHAALGGFLEHTASVVGLCDGFARHYPALNRDLLLTAAILHDIGKLRELRWDRVFDYTDAGRLIGHITIGISMIEGFLRAIPGFPDSLALQVIHCVLCHHGELEWGSPKEPMTLEALALHAADNLDAKMGIFLAFAQHAADPQHPGWTHFHKSLGRYLFVCPPAPQGQSAPTLPPRS
jgi:3'-5' exoribonuclease